MVALMGQELVTQDVIDYNIEISHSEQIKQTNANIEDIFVEEEQKQDTVHAKNDPKNWMIKINYSQRKTLDGTK